MIAKLEEAYEKGYADGSLAVTEELLKKNDLYQKGRADAIDETLNKVADMLRDYLTSDGGYVFDLDKIKEQLEEQKNE